MPEEVRRDVLAASSTRRTLDENIAAAGQTGYAAGLAESARLERARVVTVLRRVQGRQPDGTSAHIVLGSAIRDIERG